MTDLCLLLGNQLGFLSSLRVDVIMEVSLWSDSCRFRPSLLLYEVQCAATEECPLSQFSGHLSLSQSSQPQVRSVCNLYLPVFNPSFPLSISPSLLYTHTPTAAHGSLFFFFFLNKHRGYNKVTTSIFFSHTAGVFSRDLAFFPSTN